MGEVGQQHSSGLLFALFVRLYSAKVHITHCSMCVFSDTLRPMLVWFGSCLWRGTCKHFYTQKTQECGHKRLSVQALHETVREACCVQEEAQAPEPLAHGNKLQKEVLVMA